MKAAGTAVLLANDSETPDSVAAWAACDLARRVGARLFVVHVAQLPERTLGGALSSKIPAYTVLATLVARCASAGALVTRANLRFGAADEEILAEATEVGAGLIVVAGRRCGPAERQEGDELGARLARRAPCPVLIARDNESGKAPLRLTIAGTGTAVPRRAGLQRAAASRSIR